MVIAMAIMLITIVANGCDDDDDNDCTDDRNH